MEGVGFRSSTGDTFDFGEDFFAVSADLDQIFGKPPGVQGEYFGDRHGYHLLGDRFQIKSYYDLIKALEDRCRERKTAILIRTKRIRERDPERLRRIVDSLLATDRTLGYIAKLAAFLAEQTAKGASSIEILGD